MTKYLAAARQPSGEQPRSGCGGGAEIVGLVGLAQEQQEKQPAGGTVAQPSRASLPFVLGRAHLKALAPPVLVRQQHGEAPAKQASDPRVLPEAQACPTADSPRVLPGMAQVWGHPRRGHRRPSHPLDPDPASRPAPRPPTARPATPQARAARRAARRPRSLA